jgi:predicted kinase
MDCIEFNARFRYGDVIGDLAFLLMDLDARGRPDLADEVLARYLTITTDSDAGRLLDFYRCYRAYVRGKVNGFQVDDPAVPEAQRAEAAEKARHYFRLAACYANAERAPRLVVVMGAAASGKSYLAAALAGRLGAPVLSSDLARKQLFGISARDHSGAAAFGKGMYAAAPTRDTYARLRRDAEAALVRGEPVILDATFTDEHERRAILALAGRCRVPYDFVVCDADEDTVRRRLRERTTDRSAVSDATWDVARRQREQLGRLDELPADRVHRVPSGQALSRLVPQVLTKLRPALPAGLREATGPSGSGMGHSRPATV